MKTLNKTMSLFLLFAFLLGACAPTGETPVGAEAPSGKLPASASQEMTLYVAEAMAACDAAGKTDCLMVRESLSTDFALFMDDIDGFVYEPGYEYELRVIRTDVERPQAGESAYTWVLLEVVTKSQVEGLGDAPMTLPAIVGTEWAWVRTVSPDATVEANGPERYAFLLSEDGTFQARLDCNNLSGTYSFDGDKLVLSPGPMTEVACAEDSLAEVFMEGLNASGTLVMTQFGLTIELPDGGTMFFVFNDIAFE